MVLLIFFSDFLNLFVDISDCSVLGLPVLNALKRIIVSPSAVAAKTSPTVFIIVSVNSHRTGSFASELSSVSDAGLSLIT